MARNRLLQRGSSVKSHSASAVSEGDKKTFVNGRNNSTFRWVVRTYQCTFKRRNVEQDQLFCSDRRSHGRERTHQHIFASISGRPTSSGSSVLMSRLMSSSPSSGMVSDG